MGKARVWVVTLIVQACGGSGDEGASGSIPAAKAKELCLSALEQVRAMTMVEVRCRHGGYNSARAVATDMEATDAEIEAACLEGFGECVMRSMGPPQGCNERAIEPCGAPHAEVQACFLGMMMDSARAAEMLPPCEGLTRATLPDFNTYVGYFENDAMCPSDCRDAVDYITGG